MIEQHVVLWARRPAMPHCRTSDRQHIVGQCRWCGVLLEAETADHISDATRKHHPDAVWGRWGPREA